MADGLKGAGGRCVEPPSDQCRSLAFDDKGADLHSQTRALSTEFLHALPLLPLDVPPDSLICSAVAPQLTHLCKVRGDMSIIQCFGHQQRLRRWTSPRRDLVSSRLKGRLYHHSMLATAGPSSCRRGSKYRVQQDRRGSGGGPHAYTRPIAMLSIVQLIASSPISIAPRLLLPENQFIILFSLLIINPQSNYHQYFYNPN